MTLIFPGQRLIGRMGSEAIERLGNELKDRIRDLETEHTPLFRAMAKWWKWYEATPKSKEKTFPFVGASNVVVPLIGITCDAAASRSLAQSTAAAPAYWSCRTENEDRNDIARNMARYINWQADGNDFSLKHVLSEQFLETYVTGRSVCAINWRHDVRPFFFGRTPIRGSARVARTDITFHQGPLVEHVPSEHMLWDRRVRIGDALIVVRKHEWQWSELRDMAKLDDAWDKAAVEEIKKFPGVDGDEAAQIRKAKDDLDLRDGDTLAVQPHDIREVWVDWSMLGNQFEVPGEEEWGGTQVPLLVHLHMQSGRVLRLVGMPYLLPHKPFVDFRFRAGRGVAKRLEMLQSIQTTLWNQAIDSRTRSNAIWGKTRNPRHNRQSIDPSKWMLVDAMDELEPFNLHSNVQQDLPLLVAAQTMAERWMGQSDPMLGRDTRSGGHPAPATSTLALLQQVDVMSAGTDVIIQEELSRVGESIAILNQQFEDPNSTRIAQILGMADASKVAGYLFPEEPIPGNYFFDVVALSRTENPDVKMQRANMISQVFQNYGAICGQGAMVMDSPQAGPTLKAVWGHIIQGAGELLKDFLSAANVDDVETFEIKLDELRAAATQANALAQGAGVPAGGPGGFTATGSPLRAGNGVGAGAGAPFA